MKAMIHSLRKAFAIYAQLCKARILVMALIAVAITFAIESRGSIDIERLLNLMLGMTLVCSGAAAMNQVLEVSTDALMNRTRNRPILTGQMSREQAAAFAIGTSAVGISWLWWAVDPLAGGLALAMVVLYDFVYTPLKRVTSLNTLIGAVPGAMPILIGAAGTGQGISTVAWVLFGILFLWQMPHFFAIAWLHREDFERAGMKMLPVVDAPMSGRQAVTYAAALVPVSLLPAMVADSSPVYFFGALALSLGFLAFALRFWWGITHWNARLLMRASLVYLPLLLVLLLVDSAVAANS